ncbi:MAG: hypothetical protein ACREUE_17095 [Panacagrimonas sp.]
MRLRSFSSLLAGLTLAASALAIPVTASATRLADVSIHDRRDGRELPVHWYQGRRYVVGEPGREYEIRVRNYSGGRVLAVTSVDGVNVLSGETASAEQSGYVVGSHDQVRIDGWRKTLSEVAAFYFTRLPDAYAARTGRPGDVGVIGVALFRERTYLPPSPPPPRPCCWPWRRGLEDSDDDQAAAPGSADSAAGASSAPVEAEARRDRAEPPSSMAKAQKKAERLGTGHGERLDSSAQRVEFERASDTPEEVIAIWYDTRANLVAQGVLPRPAKPTQPPRPDPFPAGELGFVPDP